uniref:Uncharacterized protein n=1 Tax=Megaselia scalaris TaxID=36166 RepID=T1H5E6_MEGSC
MKMILMALSRKRRSNLLVVRNNSNPAFRRLRKGSVGEADISITDKESIHTKTAKKETEEIARKGRFLYNLKILLWKKLI